jgi:hypothetical protein
MATSQSTVSISGEAGSAIVIYRLVTQAADGQYDHTGAQAHADGVSEETQATVGGSVGIAIPNGARVKLECGGNVTAGGKLEAMADGKVQDYAGGLGDSWVGKAQEAGVDGQIITVLFTVDLDQVA